MIYLRYSLILKSKKMKKVNFKGLRLNKKTVSKFTSLKIKGGSLPCPTPIDRPDGTSRYIECEGSLGAEFTNNGWAGCL